MFNNSYFLIVESIFSFYKDQKSKYSLDCFAHVVERVLEDVGLKPDEEELANAKSKAKREEIIRYEDEGWSKVEK